MISQRKKKEEMLLKYVQILILHTNSQKKEKGT